MKRRLTPREKKELSYQKDRRNILAESRRNANKAISRRKKWVNGSYRKHTRQTLDNVMIDDAGEIESAVQNVRRHNWRKIPDISLREYIRRSKDGTKWSK